jgi:hypothetical protein
LREGFKFFGKRGLGKMRRLQRFNSWEKELKKKMRLGRLDGKLFRADRRENEGCRRKQRTLSTQENHKKP